MHTRAPDLPPAPSVADAEPKVPAKKEFKKKLDTGMRACCADAALKVPVEKKRHIFWYLKYV